jgi:hypothetical protein
MACLAVRVRVALAVARLGVSAAAAAHAYVAGLDRPRLLAGGVVKYALIVAGERPSRRAIWAFESPSVSRKCRASATARRRSITRSYAGLGRPKPISLGIATVDYVPANRRAGFPLLPRLAPPQPGAPPWETTCAKLVRLLPRGRSVCSLEACGTLAGRPDGKRDRASCRSCAGGRRLCRAHKSWITGRPPPRGRRGFCNRGIAQERFTAARTTGRREAVIRRRRSA